MKKAIMWTSMGRFLIYLTTFLFSFSTTVSAQGGRETAKPKEYKRPWYAIFEQNLAKYGIQVQDIPYVPILDYSQSCSLCHLRYFQQWQASPHGRSFVDPFFQQAWSEYHEFYMRESEISSRASWLGEKRAGQELPGEAQPLQRVDCLSCHSPSLNVEIEFSTNEPLKEFLKAMRQGYIPKIEDVSSGRVDPVLAIDKKPRPGTDIASRRQLNYWQRLNDYVKDGVSCDYCHTITRMGLPTDRTQIMFPELYNQYYGVSYEHRFGLQKFGPIEETPTSGHTIGYSPVYQDSLFCAPCHQEVNAYGVVVQDTYNEWLSSPYSRPGRNYKTCQSCHMPSAQSLGLPPIPPSKHGPDREDAHMHDFRGTTPDFLRTAAEVSLVAERDENTIKATVTITNTGTGHMLPTGKPYHQLVLVVRAEDEEGRVFFEEIKEYEKKLGKALDFRSDVPYWEADYVVYDNRIPPQESVTENLEIDASGVSGTVYVSAQLFYRRASKSVTKVYQLIDKPIQIHSAVAEVS